MLFHYQIRGYFLYSGYVDMRKGIDSLIGLVNNELKQDPLTGDLFIFINRRKRTLKMLHWQGDGLPCFTNGSNRARMNFLPQNHLLYLSH